MTKQKTIVLHLLNLLDERGPISVAQFGDTLPNRSGAHGNIEAGADAIRDAVEAMIKENLVTAVGDTIEMTPLGSDVLERATAQVMEHLHYAGRLPDLFD